MAFYVGKGLQVAGLAGVGLALLRGLSGSIVQELILAGLAMAVFYAGRWIEA